MRTSMRVKHFLAPTLLTLAAMSLGTGCSEAKKLAGGECGSGDAGLSLNAKFEAFSGAVNALTSVEGRITSSVAMACRNIAKDLGAPDADLPTVTAGQTVSEADTKKACNLASSLIATAKAGATVQIVASLPKCEVDASAQLECNADCNVSASCTPPTLETACQPGHLSGGCSGSCEGTCTVQASATAACTGTCNGKCEGTCAGQTGTAGNEVACNGTCEGTCKGECTAEISGSATCTGECKGSCTAEFTAPKCDVKMTPPACEAAADCNAGCDGSASLKASCTPPSVTVVVTGTADTKLQDTLKANLPALLEIKAQAELAGQAVVNLGETAGEVASAFTAEVGCAVKYGADFATKLTAAASASVNVQASFSASASVSGSASSS
jgi:hypothetical protein